MTFRDLGIKGSLLTCLADIGFESPTPIQQKAIPPLLAGQDVIAIAQTGTGKTAAYALPAIQQLWQEKHKSQWALVILPTRELAEQTVKMITMFDQHTQLKVAGLIGGKSITSQIAQLEENPRWIIATPKRLMEVYKRELLPMNLLKFLILDEADRLMDMGFMPQLREILEVVPRKRQQILLSATFSKKVEELSGEFLEFPIKIEVQPEGTPAEKVAQVAYEVPNFKTKINFLGYLAEEEKGFDKVLVFTRTRESATNIAKFLARKHAGGAEAVHSNRSQTARNDAVERFRNGEVRFLVATDVASRGLDVPMVSHVVNFDLPLNEQEYVHRIGRTGRAGESGIAISFVSPNDQWYLKRIEAYTAKPLVRLPLPEKVEIMETEKTEQQEQLKAIDDQKKIDDPTFKGAFHEKKKKNKERRSFRKRK